MKYKILPIMLCSVFALAGCGKESSTKEIEVSGEFYSYTDSETPIESTEYPTDDSIISESEKPSSTEITEEGDLQKVEYHANDKIKSATLEHPMIQIGDDIYNLGEATIGDLIEAGAYPYGFPKYDDMDVSPDYIISPEEDDEINFNFNGCYFTAKFKNLSKDYCSLKDCVIYRVSYNTTYSEGKNSLFYNIFIHGGITINDSLETVKQTLGEPHKSESYLDGILTLNYVQFPDRIPGQCNYINIEIDKNTSTVIGYDVTYWLSTPEELISAQQNSGELSYDEWQTMQHNYQSLYVMKSENRITDDEYNRIYKVLDDLVLQYLNKEITLDEYASKADSIDIKFTK